MRETERQRYRKRKRYYERERDIETERQREKKGAMTLNVREKWREKELTVRKVFNAKN